MQELNKGTTDYNDMEKDLAKRQADLQVQVQLQKNEFLQREAKIYHNVYQEIWQATDYFCKQNRIDMVLRFNGEAVDVNRPDSVLTYINKPVVWYDPGLDITDQILQELNRTAINPGPANRGADAAGSSLQQVISGWGALKRPPRDGAFHAPTVGQGWPARRRESSFPLCHGRLASLDVRYTKSANDSHPR